MIPKAGDPQDLGTRSSHPATSVRTTSEVIDQAILENRVGERLLYIFGILFALTGLSVLVFAVTVQQPLMAIAGTFCTGLFWPALNSARRIRKENLAIRLLEVPLSRAKTPQEAAEMLRHVWETSFGETPQSEKVS